MLGLLPRFHDRSDHFPVLQLFAQFGLALRTERVVLDVVVVAARRLAGILEDESNFEIRVWVVFVFVDAVWVHEVLVKFDVLIAQILRLTLGQKASVNAKSTNQFVFRFALMLYHNEYITLSNINRFIKLNLDIISGLHGHDLRLRVLMY